MPARPSAIRSKPHFPLASLKSLRRLRQEEKLPLSTCRKTTGAPSPKPLRTTPTRLKAPRYFQKKLRAFSSAGSGRTSQRKRFRKPTALRKQLNTSEKQRNTFP